MLNEMCKNFFSRYYEFFCWEGCKLYFHCRLNYVIWKIQSVIRFRIEDKEDFRDILKAN